MDESMQELCSKIYLEREFISARRYSFLFLFSFFPNLLSFYLSTFIFLLHLFYFSNLLLLSSYSLLLSLFSHYSHSRLLFLSFSITTLLFSLILLSFPPTAILSFAPIALFLLACPKSLICS
ncbi:unnamed protein product [Meloidogyne enterolobii]|uniref:Uncharacterized protein n=1 Tax=Meloidogyne enterolobii TaxID=390850 RepID=A0ACB0ZC54_MELEN